MSDLAVFEQAISQLGTDTIGAGIWGGIVLIFLFVAWLTVGGYSFETSFLALWALGYILTEAGFLPVWFWLIEIMVGAVIIYFALSKVMSRGNVI